MMAIEDALDELMDGATYEVAPDGFIRRASVYAPLPGGGYQKVSILGDDTIGQAASRLRELLRKEICS